MDFGAPSLSTTSTPRDAATVLLLREESPGFAVFMIKRHHLSDVLGSAYVFPGGKVDKIDQDERWLHYANFDTTTIDRLPLGEDAPINRWHALQVAAIRETFEESSVLLARHLATTGARSSSSWVALDRLLSMRKSIADNLSFLEVITKEAVYLDTTTLLPWVRWITPVGLAKRFDTSFFLAVVPSEQRALHDNYEATESCWISPRSALSEWKNKNIQLAPATYMSLYHLAQHDNLMSVLDEARHLSKIATIQPHPFERDGVRYLALPGDTEHSISQVAIPGPTRLYWEDGRFIPLY